MNYAFTFVNNFLDLAFLQVGDWLNQNFRLFTRGRIDFCILRIFTYSILALVAIGGLIFAAIR